MMPGGDLVGQTQEARRVVVQDVALLLSVRKGASWMVCDGGLDDAGPDHLVGSEHHAVAVAGLDDPSQVAVERRPRLGVDDDPMST